MEKINRGAQIFPKQRPSMESPVTGLCFYSPCPEISFTSTQLLTALKLKTGVPALISP